jgi:hypothetical protein
MDIRQTGPGRYEAKFTVDQRGAYLVNVNAPGSGSEKAARIRTGVTVAYSPEFRDLTINEALMRQVADVTNGRVLTPGEEESRKAVFAHNLPDTISRQPIWETLLKLAIAAFLLDIAVRRIAVDPMRWLAKARSYVGSLAGRRGGAQAEQTLRDLRSARERVREQQTAAGTPTRKPHAPPSTDAPSLDASAKFDAGGATKPSKDLADAMGAAGTKEPPPAAAPKKPVQDDKPQESMTARLLKAKKRARDEENENK